MHMWAASTFAVILLISAAINAVLITIRADSAPRTYRWGRLGAWQTALVVLEFAWLTCILIGTDGFVAEPYFGAGIAAASCVVFAFARIKDTDAALRRSERIASRPPELARRIRVARIVIPSALALVGVVTIAVFSFVPLKHYDCEVQGTETIGTRFSVFTSCGDFVSDAPGSSNESLLYPQISFDLTTQGFQVLPPRLRLIAFEPSR